MLFAPNPSPSNHHVLEFDELWHIFDAGLRGPLSRKAPRNGGCKEQLVWLCFLINSLHVLALMLTDVQAPFLGTSLVPLKLVLVLLITHYYLLLLLLLLSSLLLLLLWSLLLLLSGSQLASHRRLTCGPQVSTMRPWPRSAGLGFRVIYISLSLYIYIYTHIYTQVYTHNIYKGQSSNPQVSTMRPWPRSAGLGFRICM